MSKIYALSRGRPGEGWVLRFSLTGFAFFWGDFPRKTFQFHWAGYIPFSIVRGDSLDGHRCTRLFR